MFHFPKNKILVPVQHGFRSKHSCESKLLITTDECIQNVESKTQTDLLSCILVRPLTLSPHHRLLHKFDHYRIRGITLNWIQNFLTNIPQKVVVDGSSSESARLMSGVPQTYYSRTPTFLPILMTSLPWSPHRFVSLQMTASCIAR